MVNGINGNRADRKSPFLIFPCTVYNYHNKISENCTYIQWLDFGYLLKSNMNLQKAVIILGLYLFILWPLRLCQSSRQEFYHLKLIGIKCSPNEKYMTNVSCKTKPKGRYETSLSGKFDIVKPQTDFNVRIKFEATKNHYDPLGSSF